MAASRRPESPSIRARSSPGDLFIALKGEATDGHLFLDKAFAAGAAGAIVSDAGSASPHVRVADTDAALNDLGRAARATGPPRGSAE